MGSTIAVGLGGLVGAQMTLSEKYQMNKNRKEMIALLQPGPILSHLLPDMNAETLDYLKHQVVFFAHFQTPNGQNYNGDRFIDAIDAVEALFASPVLNRTNNSKSTKEGEFVPPLTRQFFDSVLLAAKPLLVWRIYLKTTLDG